MGMKFESNIMFSAAAHVTLIAIALIFAGRGAVSRVPERYIRVTLAGQGNQEASVPSGGTKSSIRTARATVRGPAAAGTRKPALPAPRHKTVKVLSPEHKRSAVRPVRAAVPLPEKRAEVPKATPPQAGKALTEEKKGLVPATEERNFLSGRGRFTIDISSYSTAEPGAGPYHSAEGSVSTSDSREKGAGIDGAGKAGGKGRYEAIGEIRALIERAKRYPLFARDRGIEGKVTAEFSIDANGLPEDLRIKRSSGFAILDSAARETIVRAAPFPLVRGSVEIPITFRLEREE